MNLTPIEIHGDILVKREDLFAVAGVRGAKARAAHILATAGTKPLGLVTAGSRASPQVNIVAHIAREMDIPCRVHTPMGQLSAEVEMAQECGALVIQHKAGYNSVIKARAAQDAAALGWRLIPFGMECAEAVESTRLQVSSIANIAEDGRRPARIVVPVGSGMNLCGILRGLATLGLCIPVVGVRVGADPAKRLQAWTTPWERANLRLVDSPTDYHAPAPDEWVYKFPTFVLDPHYEAKCVPFLQAGDLLWVVGVRASVPPF